MNNDNIKREIDELVHDIPSSQIELEKPIVPKILSTNMVENGKTLWSQESKELLSDFEYGLSAGKFGDNSFTTKKLLKRLKDCIDASIVRVYKNNNASSEGLKLHLQAIESIFMLLGKDIENSKLSQYNVKSLLAVMHGFLESYVQEVVTKKQRISYENRSN